MMMIPVATDPANKVYSTPALNPSALASTTTDCWAREATCATEEAKEGALATLERRGVVEMWRI